MSSVSDIKPAVEAVASPPKLDKPPAATGARVDWPYAVSFVIYHASAALVLLPWLLSWTGVVAFVLGIYVFGTLGINLCYHRLLTHRSFACPKWLEHFL